MKIIKTNTVIIFQVIMKWVEGGSLVFSTQVMGNHHFSEFNIIPYHRVYAIKSPKKPSPKDPKDPFPKKNTCHV